MPAGFSMPGDVRGTPYLIVTDRLLFFQRDHADFKLRSNPNWSEHPLATCKSKLSVGTACAQMFTKSGSGWRMAWPSHRPPCNRTRGRIPAYWTEKRPRGIAAEGAGPCSQASARIQAGRWTPRFARRQDKIAGPA